MYGNRYDVMQNRECIVFEGTSDTEQVESTSVSVLASFVFILSSTNRRVHLFASYAYNALKFIMSLKQNNSEGLIGAPYFFCSKRRSDMNSSHASAKLSLIDAFSLHSVCVPVINMHKGRVHDVTHCFNLG